MVIEILTPLAKAMAPKLGDAIGSWLLKKIIKVKGPSQLHSPPGDFTGRVTELKELKKKILKEQFAIIGVHGMGGIGKTTLALKLAKNLTTRYSDAQIYIDLKGMSETPLTPIDIMAHVIRSFDPEAKLPDNEDTVGGIYRSKLEGKKTLLLLDNAKDKDQVEKLIPPEGSILIITSRQKIILPKIHSVDLKTMSEEDAKDLLLEISKRIKEHADAIAKLCGYLPLALRVAGSILAKRETMKPEELLEKLEAKQGMEEVDASLSLSCELLDEETRNLWYQLSVFPDSFDWEAATAVWNIEPEKAKEILGDLTVYSLLEYHLAESRYRLHDLARNFAYKQLPDEERFDAERLHAFHYKKVLQESDGLYSDENLENLQKGLELFDREWTNIQAGQRWAADHWEKNGAITKLCNEYPNTGARIIELRLPPKGRIRWRDQGLQAAERSDNREYQGLHLGNLGIAYGDLGETRKAIEYFEKARDIAREIGDRRGEGGVLGNLGIAYRALGETRKAIEYYEKQFDIAREIGDRLGEGYALGNMGTAYNDLGETRKAIKYYEQHIVIAREIGDRRGEGSTLGNLGIAYKDLGETRKAIGYYEQHREIAREIGDRRGEGNTLWNWSLAEDKLGNRERAIELAEESLEIYIEIEAPFTPNVRKQLEEWRGDKS